ncbi:DUF397 domain-containing protein [Streptomyces sp. NPDC059853]|uniref:DUF397 domain-containing protein n=1 Tax=Streptomyces sp. NPDC059853 TaxID=3346973 RepID=UPI00366700B1
MSVRWHISSYSSTGNNCLEHAPLPTGLQAVRDTKARTCATLLLPAAAWQSFVTATRTGSLAPLPPHHP